mmetsp:Transcript_31688/g.50616  ORF Transcript_31688/g.50616 Transcript_31688/m.50616 type:complete len:100 (+) Transcript_31688:456-755(+)
MDVWLRNEETLERKADSSNYSNGVNGQTNFTTVVHCWNIDRTGAKGKKGAKHNDKQLVPNQNSNENAFVWRVACVDSALNDNFFVVWICMRATQNRFSF